MSNMSITQAPSILREHLRSLLIIDSDYSLKTRTLRVLSAIPGTIGLPLIGGFFKIAMDKSHKFPKPLSYTGWTFSSAIPVTLSSRTALNFYRSIRKIWNAKNIVSSNVFYNNPKFSFTVYSTLLSLGLIASCYATGASAFGIYKIMEYLEWDTSSGWSWIVLWCSQYSSFTTNFTLFLQILANPLTHFLDNLLSVHDFKTQNASKQEEILDGKIEQLMIDAILKDYIENIDKVKSSTALRNHFNTLNQINPEDNDMGDYFNIIIHFWKNEIINRTISVNERNAHLENVFKDVKKKVNEYFSYSSYLKTFGKYFLCFIFGGIYTFPNLIAGDDAGKFAERTHRLWAPFNFLTKTSNDVSLIGFCSFLVNAVTNTYSISLLPTLLIKRLSDLINKASSIPGKAGIAVLLILLNSVYAATQVGYGSVFMPEFEFMKNHYAKTAFLADIAITAFAFGLFSDINFFTAFYNYWFNDKKSLIATSNNHPPKRYNSLRDLARASISSLGSSRGNSLASVESLGSNESTSLLNNSASSSNGSPTNRPLSTAEMSNIQKTLARQANYAQGFLGRYNLDITKAIADNNRAALDSEEIASYKPILHSTNFFRAERGSRQAETLSLRLNSHSINSV